MLDGRAHYNGLASFKTWLFAVIRLTAAEERRRRWLQKLGIGRYEIDRGNEVYHHDPATAIDQAFIQTIFLESLKQLPRRQREVLHLVFYQEMTLSEAANVMQVSIGAVRKHYERGKDKLRTLLDKNEAFNEYRQKQ